MEWVVILALLAVLGLVVSGLSTRQKERQRATRANEYQSAIEREKEALLEAPDRMSLAPLNPGEHRYRPVGKESIIAIQDGASRMELRSSGTYRTRGTSLSIPIVKGVRYRIGGGTISSDKVWKATASGRLVLTDKAVVFESSEKNERITWTQISDVELMLDGYRISKRSGPARTYLVDNPDARFAAALELMLSRVD